MAEITLTNDNFSETVLRSGKTVLVDFWAEWCGPCRMLAPVIEEIARDHAEITVGKVNVDEQPALASMFGITSIPTVIVFKNGQVSGTSVGFRQKSELEQML
jgi:thioredoxin 1